MRATQATELGLVDVAEALHHLLEQIQEHVRDLRTAPVSEIVKVSPGPMPQLSVASAGLEGSGLSCTVAWEGSNSRLALTLGGDRHTGGPQLSAADKAKDKLQAAKGKVKKDTGRAIGDPYLEGEGKKDQVAGNVKQAGEKVKDAFRK